MRPVHRWRGHGVATLLVVAALGACGDKGELTPEATAIQLEAQVQQVREAAEAGDVEGARARLMELDLAVEDLQASGEISGPRAQRISGAATDVDRSLDLLTTTTVAPAPATPSPTTAEPRGSAPVDADNGEDDREDDDDDQDDDVPGDDDGQADRNGSSKDDKGRGRGRD